MPSQAKRVYLSVDMEGISGVATPRDIKQGTRAYRRALDLLHSDVNAAIEGTMEGGAQEVLVNDAHWTMTNLQLEDLHDGARLIRGSEKPYGMMQGLTGAFDVAFFIGYHARAGTAGAVLNHTILASSIHKLFVNDVEVGELGYNARLCDSLGVPVGLITGDDKTISEGRGELEGDFETVEVKTGISRFSAHCKPLERTRREIRQAAENVVTDTSSLEIRERSGPHRISVEWATSNLARGAAEPEEFEREGDRTTSTEADSYGEAYRAANTMIQANAKSSRDDIFD